MKVKLTIDNLIRQINLGRDGEVDWAKVVVIDGLPLEKDDEDDFNLFVREFGEQSKHFTQTQLCILSELYQRRGKPVKAEILYKYFRYNSQGLPSNTLNTHISDIRRKIRKYELKFKIIKIKPGFFSNDGYYMEVV